MTQPTKKLTQSPQYYSPPVEAQQELMKKSHKDRRPGDVCLGIANSDGMELLVYSENDSGGVCHVKGGLKGKKVGYISMAEVQAFIKKYSTPPKDRKIEDGIPSLFKVVRQNSIRGEMVQSLLKIENILHPKSIKRFNLIESVIPAPIRGEEIKSRNGFYLQIFELPNGDSLKEILVNPDSVQHLNQINRRGMKNR